MEAMTNIVRIPIIMRVPIMLNTDIFCVIACVNPSFKESFLVDTYSGDIQVARRNYHKSMERWHVEHPGLWNFCIIPHSSIKKFVREDDWPTDIGKEETNETENSD